MRVVDAAGIPVANATVKFQETAGSVSVPNFQTGSDGLAKTEWTLGATEQHQQVTATLAAPPAVLSKTIIFNARLSPTGGSCRVTVGNGGELPYINQEKLEQLIMKNKMMNVCICLLPGTHVLPSLNSKRGGIRSLSISGCGPGTQLILGEREKREKPEIPEQPGLPSEVTFTGFLAIEFSNIYVGAGTDLDSQD